MRNGSTSATEEVVKRARKPRVAADKAPASAGKRWQIYLPSEYFQAVDRYVEVFRKAHSVRVPRTEVVQLALRELLGREGLWSEKS